MGRLHPMPGPLAQLVEQRTFNPSSAWVRAPRGPPVLVRSCVQSGCLSPAVDHQKRCNTCKQMRALSEFNVRTAAADGLQSRCRECCREWYLKHRAEHI